jgi:hypothetical protein
MIVDAIVSLFLFGVLSTGLAWPAAARLRCSADERILVSVTLSLIGTFLFAWAIYVFSLPLRLLWILPVTAAATLALQRRSLRTAWTDRAARDLIVGQIMVTGWSSGWLALVVTYSGGSWVGDWFGHWQRAMFFLERGPHDILFNGFDPLTSRPPLANIVAGVFMALTRIDFAHYQLAMTFLGSLAFLPAALLARRFGGRNAVAVLAVMLMASPMFVQNATFAWTKLAAALFTLAAIYFFLRVRDGDSPSAGGLCAATLAAALLTHYSAGPYAVIIAVAWSFTGLPRIRESRWWKQTALAAIIGFALLATWFGWSLVMYGTKGTFLTNTSVTDSAPSIGAQLWIGLLNIRDTLVPHFLRDVNYAHIEQASRWGWWRDWFFQLYQVNFVFMFGSTGWIAVAAVALKNARGVSSGVRAGWGAAIASAVILGIAVHGARNEWGLAHICLQPLVLFGFALLAARWDSLHSRWRGIVIGGILVDCALGIALQFGAQSFLLDQWLAPGRSSAETLASYSAHAFVNLRAKLHYKWEFVGDAFVGHELAILLVLIALLALAIIRARRAGAKADVFARS